MKRTVVRPHSYLFGLCLSVALLPMAFAGNNFVHIQLPNNVHIELPRNWKAFSQNQRITLDSAVQARNEFVGMYDASSDLNFAANYYDDTGEIAASMNVRFYPNLNISQASIQKFSQDDISALDSGLHEATVKSIKVFGSSILSWYGTHKQIINNATAFITEYKRAPINNNGAFKVRLVRIFNGNKSFTMTVSYRENQAGLLEPICDRIISSLRL